MGMFCRTHGPTNSTLASSALLVQSQQGVVPPTCPGRALKGVCRSRAFSTAEEFMSISVFLWGTMLPESQGGSLRVVAALV